jgi:hypothetical protein
MDIRKYLGFFGTKTVRDSQEGSSEVNVSFPLSEEDSNMKPYLSTNLITQ